MRAARAGREGFGFRLARFFVLALLAGLSTANALDAEPIAISPSWLEVAPGVVLAGRLDLDALAKSAHTGMAVVDLTSGSEQGSSDGDRVRSLGLLFEQVPVAGAVLDSETVDRVAALVSDHREQGVILHCASGNRAAMVWAAVQLDRGLSLEEVLDVVAPLVTVPSVQAAIAAYAEHARGHSQ